MWLRGCSLSEVGSRSVVRLGRGSFLGVAFPFKFVFFGLGWFIQVLDLGFWVGIAGFGGLVRFCLCGCGKAGNNGVLRKGVYPFPVSACFGPCR